MPPELVANIYKARREGKLPGKKEQRQQCTEFQMFRRRWDSLWFNEDGLLTIMLGAKHGHSGRERVVCSFAIR